MPVAATERKILLAARGLFASEGFKGVTTKELAQAAGVSEVTLFRYFRSKEAIYRRVQSEFLFVPELVSLQADLVYKLEQDLPRIALNLVDSMQQNIWLHQMQLRAGAGMLSAQESQLKYPALRELVFTYFQEMQRRGRIKGKAEVVAEVFMQSVTGLGLNALQHNRIDKIHPLLEVYLVIFCRGIWA